MYVYVQSLCHFSVLSLATDRQCNQPAGHTVHQSNCRSFCQYDARSRPLYRYSIKHTKYIFQKFTCQPTLSDCRGRRSKGRALATCSCLHKAGALYLSFHLPQLTLICARSQANSYPAPPHTTPSGHWKSRKCNQINKLPVVSEEDGRRQTHMLAFTFAFVSQRHPTVQQHELWQQQQQ